MIFPTSFGHFVPYHVGLYPLGPFRKDTSALHKDNSAPREKTLIHVSKCTFVFREGPKFFFLLGAKVLFHKISTFLNEGPTCLNETPKVLPKRSEVSNHCRSGRGQCGRYRSVKNSLTDTCTSPLTLIISPSIAATSDDFPEPTSPTTATSLPCLISMVMLSSK